MQLFGSGTVRTGIDLGTGSVKLVRSEGNSSVERITHIGVEPWSPGKDGNDSQSAAAALDRLLARLHLSKRHLGRVAAAVGGDAASLREASLPSLGESELRRALPFEAKKHLFMENMASPILDCQILGPAPASQEAEGPQIRVLLAAVDDSVRAFPLKTLAIVGLEPEVIDLEPLAGLNALLGSGQAKLGEGKAIGLLDIGKRRAAVHATRSDGAFMSRPVGAGPPETGLNADYMQQLINRLQETVTFYRGRMRTEISSLHVCGGGALQPELTRQLGEALGIAVTVLDPIGDLVKKAEGAKAVAGKGPRFAVALGLCRWWDRANV